MAFYITTPIYYVNAQPHIGHAYTSIVCDVVARFHRMLKEEVYFLTGTDEHGIKVQQSAHRSGINPQEFTDQIATKFIDLAKLINCSYDDFIRTTESRHKAGAKYFWNLLYDKGYIYKDRYRGWYSVRDESFYQESELVDGKAPTGAEVEWLEEESYFFKLSAFQDRLLEFYRQNPNFVYPRSRYNEVINFVQGGKEYKKNALLDLSISRTNFTWGIEVPNDNKHVMYVWLDALSNYITALGFHTHNEHYKKYWPADIHVVGKDILRFHAVYWPAFLMACELPLPRKIIAHGWWTNNKQKISKSVGNIIDPRELIMEFGVDPIRYFLLKEIPVGNDGDFSRTSLISRVNSELANNIGNLVQRVISMLHKYCQGLVPNFCDMDKEILYKYYYLNQDKIETLIEQVDTCKFNVVLDEIINISGMANNYIEQQAPWKMSNNITKRNSVLYVLLEMIRCIAIRMLPFMPDSMNKILDAFSVQNRSLLDVNHDSSLPIGSEINKLDILFKKHE